MSSLATQRGAVAQAAEKALVDGDLSSLSAEDRVGYYNRVCDSLGLNPLTKPFAYLKLNGKLQLYALKDATEQFRKIHGVSIVRLETTKLEEVFVVTATARDKEGREDSATGAVSVAGLRGEAMANAIMKAETKAKRRVTLSICGMGILDETEVETIRHAETQQLDSRPALPAPSPEEQQAQPDPTAISTAALVMAQAEYAAATTLPRLDEITKAHWRQLTKEDKETAKAAAMAAAQRIREAVNMDSEPEFPDAEKLYLNLVQWVESAKTAEEFTEARRKVNINRAILGPMAKELDKLLARQEGSKV